MTDFVVTDPSGKEHIVTAPEGATQEQVLSYAKSQFRESSPSIPERMIGAAARGLPGGPIGLASSIGQEAMGIGNETIGRLGYKTGGLVTDAASNLGASPEVAAGAGTVANLGTQAIPAILGGKGIGLMSAPVLRTAGESLMYKALKPSSTLSRDRAAQAVKTMLEENVSGNMMPGANVTVGGIGQLSDKISTVANQADSLVANMPAVVSRAAAEAPVSRLTARFGNQVNPESDLAAIQNVRNEFRRNYPAIMPVQDAQSLKQGTYKVLGDKAYKGELKTADLEAQKALASGLRQVTENAVPGLGELNKHQSEMINAVKAAISRDAIAARKDPVSLGFLASNPLAAAGFMANRSELIKSLIARGLYSGQERLPQLFGGTGIAVLEAILGQEQPLLFNPKQ
jgi:hypothetical protein